MNAHHGAPLKEPNYPQPRTIDEAVTRKRLLEHNIQILSVQLRAPDRSDTSGRRLTSAQYKEWAARAAMKRAHMLSEHAQVRDYILRTRREMRTPSALRDVKDPYMFVMSLRQAITLYQKDPKRMPLNKILEGIDHFLHDHRPR